MKATDILTAMLEGNLHLVQWTLGDFTEAEMLARPSPVSASVAWQLGHLAREENHFLANKAPMPALPEDLARRISKETQQTAVPGVLPGKQTLLDAFTQQRQATIAWVRTLDDARLSEPSDVAPQICPQLHHLIVLQAQHAAMHLGQWQVVRRQLGKPILM